MVYVMLTKDFEEIEALTVIDLLRRADIDARLVSVMPEKTVTGAHGVPVTADCLLAETGEDFEMIVLPGGPGAPAMLKNRPLTEKILYAAQQGKKLAAICAAPMILGRLGLLKGRQATIYDGMENELTGAQHAPGPVVVDGNIITSKGPGTAMDFGLALIGELAGEKREKTVKTELLYRP